MPNFIALHQPVPEISLTKCFADKERNKETLYHISPGCLLACGDISKLKTQQKINEKN